jgi:hypothetical protein
VRKLCKKFTLLKGMQRRDAAGLAINTMVTFLLTLTGKWQQRAAVHFHVGIHPKWEGAAEGVQIALRAKANFLKREYFFLAYSIFSAI